MTHPPDDTPVPPPPAAPDERPAPPAPAGAASADPAAAGAAAPPAAAPGPRPPVVQFDEVSKTYDNGLTAIRHVSFTVEDRIDRGEFIAILGPSGCGKSTILRLIAGLRPQYPATTGRVLVGGAPVAGPGADRGMVFQDYTAFDHRTVADNIAFGLECRGVGAAERREQAMEWIRRVGLSVDRDADKYPHELSGGMRQRVAIARSLVLHPRIILMDEPFGALDPATRYNMQDLLVELWHDLQATVFFITHSIEEAVYLGDRVYVMSPSPGTILKQVPVPPPDRPAKDMQRDAAFMEIVYGLRNALDNLEVAAAQARGEGR
ncbi:MAG: ABC transporter ATP-binding protein [Gemmatimonadales bacterium]